MTLTQTFAGTIRIVRQFDRNGLPTREIQVFPEFTVSYSANGRTLSTPGPAPTLIALNPDGTPAATKVVGLVGGFHVPGGPPLVVDAGYLLFAGAFPTAPITVAHRRHDFFGTNADVTAFCACALRTRATRHRALNAVDAATYYRVMAEAGERSERCLRCSAMMEWRHGTWQCPRCRFKLGCCEGDTGECRR